MLKNLVRLVTNHLTNGNPTPNAYESYRLGPAHGHRSLISFGAKMLLETGGVRMNATTIEMIGLERVPKRRDMENQGVRPRDLAQFPHLHNPRSCT